MLVNFRSHIANIWKRIINHYINHHVPLHGQINIDTSEKYHIIIYYNGILMFEISRLLYFIKVFISCKSLFSIKSEQMLLEVLWTNLYTDSHIYNIDFFQITFIFSILMKFSLNRIFLQSKLTLKSNEHCWLVMEDLHITWSHNSSIRAVFILILPCANLL